MCIYNKIFIFCDFHLQEAEGVVMAIPMPGHPVPSQEEQNVLDDCRRLHDLVDSHDAVFLLTDTRESRWLPTLLCANANKVSLTSRVKIQPNGTPIPYTLRTSK